MLSEAIRTTSSPDLNAISWLSSGRAVVPPSTSTVHGNSLTSPVSLSLIVPSPLLSLRTIACPATLSGWTFACHAFFAADDDDGVGEEDGDGDADGEPFGVAVAWADADGIGVVDGAGAAAKTTAPPRMSAPSAPSRPNRRISRLLSIRVAQQRPADRLHAPGGCPVISPERVRGPVRSR